MKKLFIAAFVFCSTLAFSQGINDNTQTSPYVETTATVDTLVVPDRIFLTIHLDEKDSKGKISIERLEGKMQKALNAANVNIKKQLSLFDFGSDFSKYFLRKKDVSKSKKYKLVVFNAKQVADVMLRLEDENISNVSFYRMEYSKEKQLKLFMKGEAVKKAKQQAEQLAAPLNQRIGRAIYISDIGVNSHFDYKNNFNKLEIRNTVRFKQIEAEFRKIRISSSVKVRFQLY